MASKGGNFFQLFVAVEKRTGRDERALEKVKADPEKAQKSKKFGVYSLLLLISALVLSLFEPWLIVNVVWPVIKLAFSGFYFIIGNAVIAGAGIMIVLVPLYLVGWSRKYAKMQEEVNDSKFSKVLKLLGILAYFGIVAIPFAFLVGNQGALLPE